MAPDVMERQHSYDHVASRFNLDLLRSIAVLYVVVRHLMQHFGDVNNAVFNAHAFGVFGVLIFFVHTSYVLMHSLGRLSKGEGGVDLYRAFVVRRVFRIFPLAVALVLGVYLVINANWPASSFEPFSIHAISGGDFVANLFLVQNLFGAQNAIGPLWSLPLEMQMYLVLPFLYWLALRKGPNPILGIMLATIVLTILARYFQLPGSWYHIVVYAPAFLGGVLMFAREMANPDGVRPKLPSWALPLFLAGLSIVFMAISARGGFAPRAGIWVVGIVLALGFPLFREVQAPRLRKSTETVARYSYGIYLWHSICIWIAFG